MASLLLWWANSAVWGCCRGFTFDYLGTPRLLRESGIIPILMNSNIATVQTPAGLIDRAYFLPVKPEFVTQVIKRERPNGVFCSCGGQQRCLGVLSRLAAGPHEASRQLDAPSSANHSDVLETSPESTSQTYLHASIYLRRAGSSQANPYALIAAGVASPWGPAHGDASEAVVMMARWLWR